MTFLQYLKRLHLLIGLGSRGNTAKPGTVPTQSAGQVDELAELVEWGIMGLTNFQMLHPWGWLIRPGTLAFTTGDPQVVPTATLTNFRELVPFKDGLRKYLLSYITANGSTAEQRVYEVPWDQFRGYLDRADVQSGRPLYYTMTPDNEMRVYPTPDQGYTVRFDYLYKPKIYTTSDDALNLEDYPTVDNGGNTVAGRGLPPEHQEAAVWYAIRYWAETRGKVDTYQMADKRVRELLGPLKLRYLPTARI